MAAREREQKRDAENDQVSDRGIDRSRVESVPVGMQGRRSGLTGQGVTRMVGLVPMCSTVRRKRPLDAS